MVKGVKRCSARIAHCIHGFNLTDVEVLIYSFAKKFEIPDSGADPEACPGPTKS